MKILYLLGLLLAFAACTPRNLAYLSDLDGQGVHRTSIENTTVQKIQPDDLLSISVNSLSPEGNALFNRGTIAPAGSVTNYSTGARTTDLHPEGYLVDPEGNIRFPVLGKVAVGGLTKEEARQMLEEALQEYLKEPMVNIRFLNFRVTVIGEVNRPSTFTIPSEKINILEALGMAGDMTAYGKRENVLVIREEAGKRIITRLDLNSSEVLKSPYFYLQQNDVVYVEPDKMKQVQASTNPRTIAIITSLTTLAIIIVSRFW